jgi:hypothetical protein
MRKITLSALFIIALSTFVISCKDDAYLLTPPPTPDQSFSEDFETIAGAQGNGWTFKNASFPIGTGGWAGPAQAGIISLFSGSGYAYSFQNVAQGNPGYTVLSTVSNWIISKPLWLQNGDKIVFYTNSITVDATPFSLQLRMNRRNEGTNAGSGGDPGDFTDILTEVNPFMTLNQANSFPVTWTRFEATVAGLSKPVKGRIAFRFFAPDNYQYDLPTTMVAVDKMTYTSISK